MDILSKIVRRDNLELAWRRVRHHFDTSHYFVDHAEVARFHKDLSGNLRDVAERLASCKYRVAPFRLAPIPKHKLDRSLPPSMREVFWVEPRDQVAWMAVANVVGPLLDAQMPAWSYGNRLSDGIGARRADKGSRPSDSLVWAANESWPIFQRHVVITARRRLSGHIDSAKLNYDERLVWEMELSLPQEMRLPYWSDATQARLAALIGGVHYVAFDFRSFSESIRVEEVRRALQEHLVLLEGETALNDLISSMLVFEIKDGEWDKTTSNVVEAAPRCLEHLPVGLAVQGFLANVAMLPIDCEAAVAISQRNVEQFRYFDDHVVLASDARELYEWFSEYQSIVRKHIDRLEINSQKTKPPHFREAICKEGWTEGAFSSSDACKELLLDPNVPDKLWPLSPLRGSVALKLGGAWALHLSDVEVNRILKEIDSPSKVNTEVMPRSDDGHEALRDYAAFARLRNLLAELPAKRLLFRQALMFLCQTGVSGIGDLRSDLEARAKTELVPAVSQASFLLQLLAPLLPYVALRAIRAPEGSQDRRAAISFLSSLSSLVLPILPSASEWYLVRSRQNFVAGVSIARAILASDQLRDQSVLDVVCVLTEIMENAPFDAVPCEAKNLLSYWGDVDCVS